MCGCPEATRIAKTAMPASVEGGGTVLPPRAALPPRTGKDTKKTLLLGMRGPRGAAKPWECAGRMPCSRLPAGVTHRRRTPEKCLDEVCCPPLSPHAGAVEADDGAGPRSGAADRD